MKRRESNDHEEQIERLLAEAVALPHGPTRVELCEEAVRLADLHHLRPMACRARERLVDAASFGGRPDLMIVAFAWCLATFDEDPDAYFSAYSLLWRMKWVAAALPQFPEIELAAIAGLLDDMERRFRDYDGCLQPVVHKRRVVALQLGDLPAAAAYQKQYLGLRRSTLSDCHACQLASQAGYYFWTGKNAVGVRKVENLLASGMRCATVPDGTYSDLLIPLLRMGRAGEAMKYFKIGYSKVRGNVQFIGDWSANLRYLALTDNLDRAVKLLERHLPEVESAHSPLGQLSFLSSACLLVEVLADRREKIRLRLPPTSAFANPDGEYVLADLASELRVRVTADSERFDRRNGNGYYAEALDKLFALRRYATKVPFNE